MTDHPAPDWPEIGGLIPHSGPMQLVARIQQHSPARTVCEVDIDDSHLFAEPDGSVPAWVALEYMAQCVAVHGGLLARDRNDAPRPGLLLGTRRLQLHAGRFRAGDVLEVSASPLRGERGLMAFACELRQANQGAMLAEARINVFVADSLEALTGEEPS